MKLQDVSAIALKTYLDAKSPPTFADEIRVYLRVIREKMEAWDRPGAEAVLLEIEKRFL